MRAGDSEIPGRTPGVRVRCSGCKPEYGPGHHDGRRVKAPLASLARETTHSSFASSSGSALTALTPSGRESEFLHDGAESGGCFPPVTKSDLMARFD